MVSCHGRGGVSRGRPALYPGKRATPEANVNGARACACHKRRSKACISYSSVARRGAAAGCVACRPSPTNVQGQTPPLAHLWRGARLPLWAAPPRHAAARGPPPCAPVPPPPFLPPPPPHSMCDQSPRLSTSLGPRPGRPQALVAPARWGAGGVVWSGATTSAHCSPHEGEGGHAGRLCAARSALLQAGCHGAAIQRHSRRVDAPHRRGGDGGYPLGGRRRAWGARA